MAKQDEKKVKLSFFREVKSELKKVTYPTPAQTRKNTFIVIVIVLLVGVYIWALDFGFVNALSFILDGKPAIQTPLDVGNQNSAGESPVSTPDAGGSDTPDEAGSSAPSNIENPEILQGLPESSPETSPEAMSGNAGGTSDGQ